MEELLCANEYPMNIHPETNSSPLKMDGWNTTFLLGRPIFRGEPLVSGRVSILDVNDACLHAISDFRYLQILFRRRGCP